LFLSRWIPWRPSLPLLRASVMWDRFAGRAGAVRPLAPPEVGAALLAGRACGW